MKRSDVVIIVVMLGVANGILFNIVLIAARILGTLQGMGRL